MDVPCNVVTIELDFCLFLSPKYTEMQDQKSAEILFVMAS